jgi:hypothetical protein
MVCVSLRAILSAATQAESSEGDVAIDGQAQVDVSEARDCL